MSEKSTPLLSSRAACALCAGALVLLFCFTSPAAQTFEDYRARVSQAAMALKALQTVDDTAEGAMREDERLTGMLQSVRALLPPTETVEWGSASLTVDNQWLADALDNYQQAGLTDERRVRILKETTERLDALASRLSELSGQSEAGKDADKARLAAILRRKEYEKRTAENSVLTQLKERFIRWWRQLFPRASPVNAGWAGLVSRIVQFLIAALALAVIAYIGWKFGPRVFRRSGGKKREGHGSRIVLGELLEADQTAADLLAEAEALARAGNLRAAIRKGYIALLCELSDRKIIGLAQHKTNRDYLSAVRDHGPLYREMQALTNSFETHWYGFAPAGMDDWEAFRSRYRQALKQG